MKYLIDVEICGNLRVVDGDFQCVMTLFLDAELIADFSSCHRNDPVASHWKVADLIQ